MTAIEITGLRKSYGRQHALDGLDLSVPEGGVFGFLGPNGAGKTTTIRILLSLAHPSAGQVRVLGLDPTRDSTAVHRRIGYLPDVPAFYPWMRAGELLRLVGSLFGLPRRDLDPRIEVLLDLAGLTDVETRLGGYSRGMKQRLGIAQALVSAPRLLILDEPTSALDPMGRHDVLGMIDRLRGRTTVFFSSHDLGDVQRVCDEVAVVNHGKVVAQEGTEALRRRFGGATELSVQLAGGGDLARLLSGQAWARDVRRDGTGGWLVRVLDLPEAQRALPRLVADAGLGLERLAPVEASLEDAFVRLVAGGAA